MIQLCHLVPHSCHLSVQCDFHLLEVAWLQYGPYRDEFMNQSDVDNTYQIVLDHSTHLFGRPVSTRLFLCEAEILVKAGWSDVTLVVPDVKSDAKATYRLASEFYELWKQITFEQDVRLMLVPQGRSLEEWEENLVSLLELFHYDPRLTTMGFPFATSFPTPLWYTNRIKLVNHFLNSSWRVAANRIHLLGLSNPVELSHSFYRESPVPIYNDSSAAFIAARNLCQFDLKTGWPPDRVEKFQDQLWVTDGTPRSAQFWRLFSTNLLVLRHLASV